MKKMSITGYFTTPDYSFNLAIPLLRLIRTTIEKDVLQKSAFPNVESEELEIMLNAGATINKPYVESLSKTGRGKYLSFQFFLPYHVIVKNNDVDVTLFISEFMEALKIALSPYNAVPNEVYKTITKQLQKETNGKQEYMYVMPPKRTRFLERVNQICNEIEGESLPVSNQYKESNVKV